MKKYSRWLAAMIFAAVFTILSPNFASASTYTSWQCDSNSPPKYACARIYYTIYYDTYAQQNIYRVDGRDFQGATDGGAQKWRNQYFRDYRWTGSQWSAVTNCQFGPDAWHTNFSLGTIYVYATDCGMTGGGKSTANFEYFEVTPDYPNGYYWYWGPFNFYVT